MSYRCTTNLCIHWETGTTNSPPPADSDADGIPNQVETTSSVFEEVWAKEVVGMGFRAPKPDSVNVDSPNTKIDIYLADLGAEGGLYGYCSSDEKPTSAPWDVSAYCVMDNDYSASQYPNGTPLGNLQSTAAHEFFHAVQFAYDLSEDRWLMEGTATWIEDEVYDSVNDSYNFLTHSALTYPDVSVDYEGVQREASGQFRYGAWLFWRHLSEQFGQSVVKQIWARADGSSSGPDDFSTDALKSVLASKGKSLRATFSDFAAANNRPDLSYEEGAAYLDMYGQPPLAKDPQVLSSVGSATSGSLSIDHLSTNYIALEPAASLPSGTSLDVTLDLPTSSAIAGASVIVEKIDGTQQVIRLTLDSAGDASTSANFSPSEVLDVVLVLSNASGEVNSNSCFTFQTMFSCGGAVPLHDNQIFKYSAVVKSGTPTPTPTATPNPTPTATPTTPPPTPTTHDSTVSLTLRKHLVAKGQLSSVDGYLPCTRNAPISLFKKRSGNWRLLKTVYTNTYGMFTAKVPDKPGTYFAVAAPGYVDDLNLCARADSLQVRHRH